MYEGAGVRYQIDFELCAFVILIILLIISASERRLHGIRSRFFFMVFTGSLADIGLDLLTVALPAFIPVSVGLETTLNLLYLSMQFVLPYLFVFYFFSRIEPAWKNSRIFISLISLPATAGFVLTILSLWNRAIFYVDETGYHRGGGHFLIYLNFCIYTAMAVLLLLVYRYRVKGRMVVQALLVFFVTLSSAIIQACFPSVILIGFGIAMAVLIIFIFSENEYIFTDPVTGAMSRQSLVSHFQECIREKRHENVLVIAMDNFKLVNEICGMDGGDAILRQITLQLQNCFSDYNVYRFSGDTFVVIVREDNEVQRARNEIRKILRRKYREKGMEIDVSACICLLTTDYGREEEVVSMIEFAIQQAKTMGKGQFYEAKRENAREVERRHAIEQTILAGIHLHEFEVYYQPIYDVRNRRFHSMEALARLNVPGYGYVSPEEFIKIAEKNGTVLEIGMLVLEEVCRFIKEENLKEKGIDFIEVNLSVVQCMEKNIHRDILAVLQKYDVPPEMINLEITESAAAYSEKRLIQNMAKMSLKGLSFSLDDYGSGYSNINYIVDLPFSIVKIDKYFVWAAMKQGTSRVILENTIRMFRAIHLKIVTEGIEDAEMVKEITRMGADYIQGFYFSRPVPRDEVLKRLDPAYLEQLPGQEQQEED